MKKPNYIVVSELPKEQQEPLKKWLVGQTLPMVRDNDGNIVLCAYMNDYNHWLSYRSEGKEAPIYD